MSIAENPAGAQPASQLMLRAALEYAEKFGFYIFPVGIDKQPLTEHGFKDASRDAAQIESWFSRWPQAGVAVATGAISGIVVLDCDPRHGGDDARADLEANHGKLPDTPNVLTGGGGAHDFFRHPGGRVPCSISKIGPGLDVKADGGYIILPPSRHASGNRYCWEITASIRDTPLAEMPDWLLQMALAGTANTNGGAGFEPPPEFEDRTRNTWLYRTGRSLRRKYNLGPDELLLHLRAFNTSRCKPPLDDGEVRKIAGNCASQADSPDFRAQSVDADDLPEALRRIAEIDKQIKNDLTLSYSPDYLSAAATVSERDAQTFERLKKNLKSRGVSISNWESRVKEVVRKRAAETKAAIKNATATNAAATVTTIAPPAPEPWDRPVTGLILLNDLRDFLAKFIVVTPDVLIAITLWIVFTYLLDIAEYSPRLAITSATPRCGKTTVLDLLGELMLKPIAASNVTAAAIFRIIEQEKCGLLIDEYDTMKAGSEKFEEIRGITNSGHTRASAFVLRAVKYRDDFIVKKFSTWAAMAVAAIGRLPDTLADRSIAIPLRRKSPKQKVERLIQRNKWAWQTAADLARQIQRWVNDNRTTLQGTVPKLPDGLDDRSSNNWELLLAIAEVVGGDWPQQARQAAVKLSAGRDDAGSVGEMLIADIRKVFDACLKLDSAFDRITSAELCSALADLEARPWAEFGRSRKPITAPQLARQLRHFGIAPDSIRVGASATTLKPKKLI